MSNRAPILLAHVGRVAVIELNDPDRRNALGPHMCSELVATLDALAEDPGTGAVVVTGRGDAFCAGADLSQLGATTSEAEAGLRAIYEGFLALARCPLPTVAAVNGPAVGAGMNLALAADLRFASPLASFDSRFLELGIHPGGGHTWMLGRLVGPQATAAMVMFGQVVDPKEAERIGLVHHCIPADDLVKHAVKVATSAAAAPPELSRRVKRTIADIRNATTSEAAVDRELVDQIWSMSQPDFAERMARMRERISRRATRSAGTDRADPTPRR